jgi:uracil-DNA glycosylase
MNYLDTVHPDWHKLFEFYKPVLVELLEMENVLPAKEDILRVFEMSPKELRVVFLGQDPYHSNGIADGLSFSSKKCIPPSLQNIFKEIKNNFPERDYEFISGDLSKWFNDEKIFLLNCSLSVLPGKPSSLMSKWEHFTDSVIQYISEVNENCVFLLLGNFAKKKKVLIKNKDLIVEGVHPSPLSCCRGFFGSNVFKQVEERLCSSINWQN